MGNRLVGKTALLTGAGTGIGRQVAVRFAVEGARVVFSDRDYAAAVAAAGGGADTLAIELDVSREDSVEDGFATAREAASCRTWWSPTPGFSCSVMTPPLPTSTLRRGSERSRST